MTSSNMLQSPSGLEAKRIELIKDRLTCYGRSVVGQGVARKLIVEDIPWLLAALENAQIKSKINFDHATTGRVKSK